MAKLIVHDTYKHVNVQQYKNDKNRYIAWSYGEKNVIFTFMYVDQKNGKAVLWDYPYGALTKIEATTVDDPEAEPCYIFGYNKGRGCWSQTVVYENNMPDLAKKDNNNDAIFEILKTFMEQ